MTNNPVGYTRGPWSLSEEYYDGDSQAFTLGYGKPRGAQFVEEALGEVWGLNLTPDEFRANARLIAAAPDLLEALQALSEAVGPLDMRTVSEYLFRATNKARAAIKKALNQ